MGGMDRERFAAVGAFSLLALSNSLSSTAHDYTVFNPFLPLGLCPFALPSSRLYQQGRYSTTRLSFQSRRPLA